MPKHRELASKLLKDAAAFFDTIAEQNEPLREQMEDNSDVYRQLADKLAADPEGTIDDKPVSQLAAKLLTDASAFFGKIAEQNPPLQEQMTENADVFVQVARLVEADPMGEIVEEAAPAPEEPPASKPPSKPTSLSKHPVPNFSKPAKPHLEHAKPAVKAAQERKKDGRADTPDFSKPAKLKNLQRKTASTPEPQAKRRPEQLPHPSRDPLSAQNVRLNGHRSPIDPVCSLSFPTEAVPRPVTKLRTKPGVFGRENHVCRYCGFRATKYQECVGPYDAITNSQMYCACIFCAQVIALDTVPERRSGVLIHLPEMGQAELHIVARIIYVCRISQGEAADFAKAALERIMSRREEAKARFGTDDPFGLVARLARCATDAEHRAVLDEAKDIRLFPLDRRIIKEGDLEYNQFPQILAYWRASAGPFGGLVPAQMDLTEFRRRIEGIFGSLAVDA